MRLAPLALLAPALVLISSCDRGSDPGTVSNSEPLRSSGIRLEYIDHSVSPAEDFFRFANGNWLKTTEIPPDKARYSAFDILADRAREDIRNIVAETLESEGAEPGTEVQQIGDFYRSFMNTEAIEARGLEALEPLLAEIDAIETYQELGAFFGRAARRGITNPLSFYVSNDVKQPDRYITYFSHSGLGLPDRDYYLRDDERHQSIRQEYQQHITTMFQLAGRDNGPEAAPTVLAIEHAIAEHHWPRAQLRDRERTYNKFAVSELVGEDRAAWGWESYLHSAGLHTAKEVILAVPSFFEALDELLQAFTLDQWRDYLRWHTISAYASVLPEALDQENFRFYGQVLRGMESQEERWKRAIDLLNSRLGDPLGKLYVERHFSPESKIRMEELVENLREAYRQSILELDWMTETTKAKAIEKLEKFNPKIGYPDKWRDFSGLEIKPDDLFGNLIRANEFHYHINVAKLGQPVDRDEWFMNPQTVNAYYNPGLNEIVFPAAILQPPFFNPAADDAVNYGAIGAVIGHEMGHGFDDQGSRSDGDGLLRNWWTEEDLQEFRRRTQQLVEQYSAYTVLDGVHLNGELTQGENIGDLGGLTVAYKAYLISLEGKEAPVLDGFTGPQRFFLGWGQVWASKYRDAELRRRILTDPHSPPEYRVNGVLRNMPQFHAAFDVKPGDPMYLPPEQQVKIW